MKATQAVTPQVRDTELRRRPRRPELLMARALETRLKAERVQEMLKQMPGWSLLPSGRAIDRIREFPTPEMASEYAAWVLSSASRMGRSVTVRLAPGRV